MRTSEGRRGLVGSADELAWVIRRANQMVADAVTNGAAATTEGNEAVAFLRNMVEKLKGSKAYAGQQLGNITSAMDLLMPSVAGGRASEHLYIAYNRLNFAREKVQNYYNGLQYRIENFERMTALLQEHVNFTVDEAAAPLLEATQHLTEYESGIL